MNGSLSQLLSLVIAAQFLLTFSYVNHLTQKLPASNIPDLWIGYSTQDLNELFDAWGPKGRKNYVQVAKFDMAVFIPSYALMTGYIFYNVVQDMSTTLWWVSFIAWCDYLETFVLMIYCASYPNGDVMHMDTLVQISSYANMGKWLSLLSLVVYCAEKWFRKKEKKD